MAKRAGTGVRKPVNLALQGGGAQGAVTWGVLDRLFEGAQYPPPRRSGSLGGW